MISIYLMDPCPGYPEFDEQVWHFFWLPMPGTPMPLGRRIGEWVWVGKINENEIENEK
jgi:hypothetical protein